jgi:hypothetical protein
MRVDSAWIKSPDGRRVLAHWADSRPAWLWSADGRIQLWRNPAARLFNAKMKRHGLKVAPEAVPIKGQVARLIRLGLPGRSSLSRIQFLAGGRPISATCSVTPLELPDRQLALLVVGVDPVSPEVLAAVEPGADGGVAAVLPEGSDYLFVEQDGEVSGGSAGALGRYAPLLQREGLLGIDDLESHELELDGAGLMVTRFASATGGTALLLLEPRQQPAPTIEEVRAEEGLEATSAEAQLPLGLPAPEDIAETPDADAGEERSLSTLFDRLADHEELYAELPPAEDVLERESEADRGAADR